MFIPVSDMNHLLATDNQMAYIFSCDPNYIIFISNKHKSLEIKFNLRSMFVFSC